MKTSSVTFKDFKALDHCLRYIARHEGSDVSAAVRTEHEKTGADPIEILNKLLDEHNRAPVPRMLKARFVT